MIVTDEIATIVGGKAEIRVGDISFYSYPESDSLGWGLIFYSKPATNIFEFELKHSPGLYFVCQPELTAKELKKRPKGIHNRPDNVINSYVGFINKRNGKYKTGKFCHLFRPRLTDDVGEQEWATQEITTGKLTITMPQAYLDTAKYPVKVGANDGNLGYSVKGGTSFGSDTTYRIAIHDTTDAGGGDTVEIHAYVLEQFGANQDFELALYSDDAGNDRPEDRQGVAATLTNPDSNDGEIKQAFVRTLAGSTKYWVVWSNFPSSFATNDIYYDDNSIANSSNFFAQEVTLPANWGDVGTNSSWQYSIWVDYSVTPTGAAGIMTTNAGYWGPTF